jgi:cation transport regulator ChaB
MENKNCFASDRFRRELPTHMNEFLDAEIKIWVDRFRDCIFEENPASLDAVYDAVCGAITNTQANTPDKVFIIMKDLATATVSKAAVDFAHHHFKHVEHSQENGTSLEQAHKVLERVKENITRNKKAECI